MHRIYAAFCLICLRTPLENYTHLIKKLFLSIMHDNDQKEQGGSDKRVLSFLKSNLRSEATFIDGPSAGRETGL